MVAAGCFAVVARLIDNDDSNDNMIIVKEHLLRQDQDQFRIGR